MKFFNRWRKWCSDQSGHTWQVHSRIDVITLGHGRWHKCVLECKTCGKRRTHYMSAEGPNYEGKEIGRLLALRC